MRRFPVHQILAACFLAWSVGIPISQAAELKGVNLPDSVQVDGKKLKLNGMGVLQKSLLKVNVYVAGLYLENKTQDGTAALRSAGLKRLVLVFLREATAKQITDAWTNDFMKNCPPRCESLRPRLDRLNAMIRGAKPGQEFRFTFYEDSMTIATDKIKVKIQGRDFAETILSTFIGPKPTDDSLKEGLLAQSD